MTALDTPILLPPSAPKAPPARDDTQRVDRPPVIRTTGPLITAIVAFLTCGLLPLWGWLWQWNSVRRQDNASRAEIGESASILLWIPLLLLVVLTAEAGWMFAQGFAPEQVRDALLGHGLLLRFDHHAHFVPLRLPTLWNGGLFIAYGCYWAAVRTHIRRRVPLSSGPPVTSSPLWLLAAICFGIAHLWWGIPMMFAGERQRRYLSVLVGHSHSPRPAMPSLCTTARCAARLPTDAKFCPRCGTAKA